MATFDLQSAPAILAEVFPPWVLSLRPEIVHIGDGQTVLAMPLSPVACREGGTVSGQAIAALADTAMVCALWAALGEQRPVATVDLHVTYLRAAKDGLRATAEVVKQGRSLSFARVSIASDSEPDRPVATAVGTFATGA
ncbi:PaaI family thioesterase [Variovorax sp. UC122_21]|uniref:PaaI family thioesterase n=1 Tax=Variovorax TaxID=34072 RepID=UPI0019337730|nr:PaaI family thioesterase [Variovorax paradoxus]